MGWLGWGSDRSDLTGILTHPPFEYILDPLKVLCGELWMVVKEFEHEDEGA